MAREMTGELIDQAARDAGFPGQSYVKQEAILSIQGNDTFISMPCNEIWQICYLPLVFDRANKRWSIWFT